ncbi:MAG TPA: hypothetical protein VK489_11555 [Ferruginibacter sp.]|nr:hypothetical protein [Ferruginibacter sp.]
MLRYLIVLFCFPLLAAAQNKPRFEKDTLYTSCGYKIYTGQSLQLGKALDRDGFRYISPGNGSTYRSLENNTILVTEIFNTNLTVPGNGSIELAGKITYRDGSKGKVSLRLLFDKAIGNFQPGKPGELIVPEQYRVPSSTKYLSPDPSFDYDTLYTSCGYKIYPGQLLQFGKATGGRQRFNYVNIKTRTMPGTLQNNQVLINKLTDYGISKLGNGYITIMGTLYVNNNERGPIELHVAFDLAIENLPGIPSEIVVPERFRKRRQPDPEKDIARINRLYEDDIISREELDAVKEWLLKQ